MDFSLTQGVLNKYFSLKKVLRIFISDMLRREERDVESPSVARRRKL